jgi:hypothetical protein
VRHGGRGPFPPLHDLENLGVEVFSQATHDGCVFRERGIADSMVVFRIAIPVLTHEFG